MSKSFFEALKCQQDIPVMLEKVARRDIALFKNPNFKLITFVWMVHPKEKGVAICSWLFSNKDSFIIIHWRFDGIKSIDFESIFLTKYSEQQARLYLQNEMISLGERAKKGLI